MSQQSVSEFNIFEGNSTVENATHLMMIIDYDVGQCDEDDDTIPCTYLSRQMYDCCCVCSYMHTCLYTCCVHKIMHICIILQS